MGQMSAQFLHNRAFCKESTTSTECVDFYTSMNTRYGALREINAASINRISDILILLINFTITDNNLNIPR